MKCTPILLLALLIACSTPTKNFPPASSSIEAGRNYVEACLQGDFEKAVAYAATSETMKLHTANTEKNYRDLDKEGRSNFRQASIIILGITDNDSLHTQMNYQYSLDKKSRQLEIEKTNGKWLVVAVKE
jgi:UDP-N-acetylglucosamine 2-epimerase